MSSERRLTAPKSSTHSELEELYRTQLTPTQYTIVQEKKDTTKDTTAPDAVAIIIDIFGRGGAIHIGAPAFNSLGVESIAKIGDDKAFDNLVVMRWEKAWYYYTMGDVRIRYLVPAEENKVT